MNYISNTVTDEKINYISNTVTEEKMNYISNTVTEEKMNYISNTVTRFNTWFDIGINVFIIRSNLQSIPFMNRTEILLTYTIHVSC